MGGHWCLKLYSMGQEGEAKLFYFHVSPVWKFLFLFFFLSFKALVSGMCPMYNCCPGNISLTKIL